MKKIKLKTNKGPVVDWLLNNYLNFKLWLAGIYDDEDQAVQLVSEELNWLEKKGIL